MDFSFLWNNRGSDVFDMVNRSSLEKHFMTNNNQSLIEAIKEELDSTIHLAAHTSEPGLCYVDGLMVAIAIVRKYEAMRQHEATQPQFDNDTNVASKTDTLIERCNRCGWPIVPEGEAGCWKNNCSMRPMPPEPFIEGGVRAGIMNAFIATKNNKRSEMLVVDREWLLNEFGKAYHLLEGHKYECTDCKGTGREQDNTPCSNPNDAAKCQGCGGEGYFQRQPTIRDRLDAGFAILDPYLNAPMREYCWEPMKSAPQDGTRIIVLEGTDIWICSWDGVRRTFHDDGTCTIVEYGWTDGMHHLHPDGWVPIPKTTKIEGQ
jgi:hypothetical protein